MADGERIETSFSARIARLWHFVWGLGIGALGIGLLLTTRGLPFYVGIALVLWGTYGVASALFKKSRRFEEYARREPTDL